VQPRAVRKRALLRNRQVLHRVAQRLLARRQVKHTRALLPIPNYHAECVVKPHSFTDRNAVCECYELRLGVDITNSDSDALSVDDAHANSNADANSESDAESDVLTKCYTFIQPHLNDERIPVNDGILHANAVSACDVKSDA